jgi:hypothetical protein
MPEGNEMRAQTAKKILSSSDSGCGQRAHHMIVEKTGKTASMAAKIEHVKPLAPRRWPRWNLVEHD